MMARTTIKFIAQHERLGGQAGSLKTYWQDYHKQRDTRAEAQRDLDGLMHTLAGSKFETGRVRVIRRTQITTDEVMA